MLIYQRYRYINIHQQKYYKISLTNLCAIKKLTTAITVKNDSMDYLVKLMSWVYLNAENVLVIEIRQ